MTGFTLPRRQRGSTLVVALVLLLVMSLLAATSLRGTALQERMSANAHDRDLAFQSAEVALRMGERQAEKWGSGGLASPPGASTSCPTANAATGLYNMTNAANVNCTPLWEQPATFWHRANNEASTDITFGNAGLSLAPYYIVELIEDRAPCNPATPASARNCKRFRITAASDDDGGNRARVVLQSIYATE
ncbi:MAG: pilus assembly protein [Azoarcus sp.]|jgi:type IV pilus assembly protein PilX|nr:pilus assembly protein [Azoarcus sp.]